MSDFGLGKGVSPYCKTGCFFMAAIFCAILPLSAQDLFVGSNSSGELMEVSSDTVVYDNTYVGYGINASNNILTIQNYGTQFSNNNEFYIGYSGKSNGLNVISGGQIAIVGGAYIGFGAGSTGNQVIVSDGGTTWTNTGDLYVGYDGAVNSLLVSNGAAVNVGGSVGGLVIGGGAGSTNNQVLGDGTGSSLGRDMGLTIGAAGSGTLTLARGGGVSAGSIVLAAQPGSAGTLNVGTLGGSDSNLIIGGGPISFGAGSGTINFNQGDIFTLAADVSSGSNGVNAVNQLGSGTTILSGNNSYSGNTVVRSGTLVALNPNAFGIGTVTVKNGGTLSVDSVISNVLSSESGAVVSIHSGGGITASSLGSGSLMLSGSPGSPATLVSTVSGLGTLEVGPLTLNGYSTLNMVAGTTISSSGDINISGLGNVLNVSGSFGSGTYTLVSGSSLSATGVSLTGVAVGGSTIALDSTGAAGRASYAFTKTPVALQVVVVGVPWNIAFNSASGSWNTNPSNLTWQTLAGKTNTSFYPNDNVYFTNGATVTVAGEGVAPGNMSIGNPAGTTVSLNGGAISTASLNASGAGTATIADSLNIASGATFSAGI